MAEEQGHMMDKERLRQLSLLSPGSEKSKEGPMGSLPLPKELGRGGEPQRRWSQTFPRGAQ